MNQATNWGIAVEPCQFRQFVQSYEALGIVLDFVTRGQPFDRFRAGKLVTAVKHQLAHGHHACAVVGERLVGYCGWLPITEDVGNRWLQGEVKLVPAAPESADAVALTLVLVEDATVLRPLIRAARRLAPNKRVFFVRNVNPEDDRIEQRRSSVLNYTADV